jgi:hypothetical protein
MTYDKSPTLFFASYSCQEGLTSNDVLKKQTNISDSIINYKNAFNELNTRTGKYSNDILDDNGNIIQRKTLKDAVRNDIQILLIQENTMYVIGIITTASLILTAILISK